MHPLKSLLESRTTVATQPPGGNVATAIDPRADRPMLTAGWPVSPGFSILAIQDPPSRDGRAGAIEFGPNLTLAERRQIVSDLEYWDRVDARRKRIGKNAAGRLLDGREWNEMPEVKR